MANTLGDLKTYYNELIAKHKKGMRWLEDSKVDFKKKMEWLDSGKYNALTVELSNLIAEYEKLTGKEMTEAEILEGFKEGDKKL